MLIRRRKALDDAEKKQIVQPQISETIAAMPRAELEARLEASYTKVHMLEILNDDLVKESVELREQVGVEEVSESDLVETLKMDYPDRSWGRPACRHRNEKEPYTDERMEKINQHHTAMRKSIMDKLEREHKHDALSRFTAVITVPPTSKSVQDTVPIYNKRRLENEGDDEDASEAVRTSLREDTPNPEEVHHPKKLKLVLKERATEQITSSDPFSISTTTSSDSMSAPDKQSTPTGSVTIAAENTTAMSSLSPETSSHSLADTDQNQGLPPPTNREQKRRWRDDCGGQRDDKDDAQSEPEATDTDIRLPKRIKLVLTKNGPTSASQSASRTPKQNSPVPENSTRLTESAAVCRIKRVHLILRGNPAASAPHSSATPSKGSLSSNPTNASASSTTELTPEGQRHAPWRDPFRRITRSLAQARDNADAMRQ